MRATKSQIQTWKLYFNGAWFIKIIIIIIYKNLYTAAVLRELLLRRGPFLSGTTSVLEDDTRARARDGMRLFALARTGKRALRKTRVVYNWFGFETERDQDRCPPLPSANGASKPPRRHFLLPNADKSRPMPRGKGQSHGRVWKAEGDDARPVPRTHIE